MDFGFMRELTSDYKRPNKHTDRVVTSYNGYSSHLIIVDIASRRVWAFLTKTKEPPLDILSAFMKKIGMQWGYSNRSGWRTCSKRRLSEFDAGHFWLCG